jgi:hypothetical protein
MESKHSVRFLQTLLLITEYITGSRVFYIFQATDKGAEMVLRFPAQHKRSGTQFYLATAT